MLHGRTRRNMSNKKRRELADSGRGSMGKTAVVGARDRDTNQVAAKVSRTPRRKRSRDSFMSASGPMRRSTPIRPAPTSVSLSNQESVKHSAMEFVRSDAYTNGVESLWSMLKRGHVGVYHKMSPKHLDRYVRVFAGRQNVREMDTLAHMSALAQGMDGNILHYRELIADNGLPSGARS